MTVCGRCCGTAISTCSGASGIPQSWLNVLAKRDLITDLADALTAGQT
jgi:hypothetical protein